MAASTSLTESGTSLSREQALIQLLLAYLLCGLLFMLLPGTFFGVWNLFAISIAKSATSVSPAWVQAHGHAQLFGWIGCFIMGIGFYSIPNLRRVSTWSFWEGWLCLLFWTGGISLRWFANVYQWQWEILLPLSANLELAATLLFFFRSIQGHRVQGGLRHKIESWAVLVIVGTIGLIATMGLNVFETFRLAISGASPVFPASFNNKFLTFSLWSFVLPIAWGFSAHWLPIFLGLKPVKSKYLNFAIIANCLGLIALFSPSLLVSTILFLAAAISIVLAIRLFEAGDRAPKTQGVHESFPVFIRIAYTWLVIASLLAVWAQLSANSHGISGAGRHALTVGFLMTMVFTIGPRVLPAFLGREKLYSKILMFLALLTINTGCLLRVISEILAYQNYAAWAWLMLPLSATLELAGVVIFTINMLGTFVQPTMLPPQR
jgi:hypothetical protein